MNMTVVLSKTKGQIINRSTEMGFFNTKVCAGRRLLQHIIFLPHVFLCYLLYFVHNIVICSGSKPVCQVLKAASSWSA